MKERNNRLLRHADTLAGIPLVFLSGLFRRKRKVPQTIDSVGFFFFSAMGDTLISSSIVPDVKKRYPKAKLIAFASRGNKGLTELVGGFDEIIEVNITNPASALRSVRSRAVDILIDCGQWPRINAVLSFLAKAKLTIGFETAGQYRHYGYDIAVRHRNDQHELENFRDLVRCLGIAPTETPRLGKIGEPCALQPNAPYVVFHPWAAGFRHELREWPTDRWQKLAADLTGKGFTIAITGGLSDHEKSVALARLFTMPPVILAGQCGIGQTARVLQDAACVICVNTGVMHMAAALDVPVIALHGPTNPKRWGPLSARSIVLGASPEEGGAYLNLGFEYPPNPADCMSKIDVKDVINAFEKITKP